MSGAMHPTGPKPKRVILELGTGNDLHGGDYTKAAIRAVQDALHHSSLSIIRSLGLDSRKMLVEVTIGVQRPDKVDAEAVKATLPHGQVSISGEGRPRRARRHIRRHRGDRQRRGRGATGPAPAKRLRRNRREDCNAKRKIRVQHRRP